MGAIVGAVAAIVAGAAIIVRGSNSVILGILRQFVIWLDSCFFSIASWSYGIFYELSSSSLLSNLNLASAGQRLYTLLGIFMLFRLAFSFIKFIVNPDDMEKGTSKFITNLAISLALIVSVPWIFNRAFELQRYIMESNVIGNLILGMDTGTTNSGSDTNTFNASSYGQSIAFMVFNAFYRPDPSIDGLSSCNNLLVYYNDYVVPASDSTVEVKNLPTNASSALKNESDKIAACINALNKVAVDKDTHISNLTGKEGISTEIGTKFYIASQRKDISLLTDPDILNAINGSTYLINYVALISTIALGFLALLFISFSFDVAIRNVKLCFLQVIAPIPIILNIEPGDTKGDKKSLNWWINECLRTYVDLFVRVATVYFGVFLINVLFTSEFDVLGSNNTSVWFKIFMIFGILLFVKQIPEMIGKAFGIDVKGQFNLNPLKRIGENRLASMVTGGALGLATGLGNFASAGVAAHRAGAKRREVLSRAITGGIGGTAHSMYSGAKKGVKSLGDITGNAFGNYSRSGRIAGANVGTSFFGRMGSKAAMVAGAPTKFDRMQQNSKEIDEMGNIFGQIKSFAQSDGTKLSSVDGNTSFRFTNSMGGSTTADLTKLGISSAKDAHDYVERIKASGASDVQIKLAEDLEKAVFDNYYSTFEGDKKHFVGAKLQRFNDLQAKQQSNLSGVGPAANVNDMKKYISTIKNQAALYVTSDEYLKAEKDKNAAALNGPGGRK